MPGRGEGSGEVRGSPSSFSSLQQEAPMPVTVRIPTPLQQLSGGKSEVACDAATVAGLVRRWSASTRG